MTNYSRGAAFVDDTLVPIDEAKISILDWGFLHSDATYDVVHVWNGSFFRLDDHLDRFFQGMERLHLAIPYSRTEVRQVLNDCVRVSGLQNAYVEMITTRGLPRPGSRDPRTCTNRFYAFAVPFVWIAEPDRGLHLVISDRQRIPTESVDPAIKNYHWLDLVMGQFEAFARGAEAAVLVDAVGNIKEGPGFNVFAVKNSVIRTPGSGVLEGITRKTTIEIAQELGYRVILDELSASCLLDADELFATSTAGGIMPILSLDGNAVGKGETGPLTRKLTDTYWALHEHPNLSTEVSIDAY